MSFFDKPDGVGAQLNIYMFTPRNLLKILTTLISQPRYFLNRLRVMIYQQTHPNYPWLTAESIKLIESFLSKEKIGLEWGSGRSTVWFAQRMAKLISVEHNEEWHKRVLTIIDNKKIENVDYRYVSIENDCSAYSQQIEKEGEKFDFILVDGECRSECLTAAAKQIKPGGYLVLDNADLDYGIPDLTSEGFEIIRTDNGVWRTDIYICQNTS